MLALDVSKKELAVALLDPHSRLPLWERSVNNTPAGVATLLAATSADIPWVATG